MNTRSAWILDSTTPDGVRECWIEKIDPVECYDGLQNTRREGELSRQWFTLSYLDGPTTATVRRFNSSWLEYINKDCTRVVHNNQVFSSKEEALHELQQLTSFK